MDKATEELIRHDEKFRRCVFKEFKSPTLKMVRGSEYANPVCGGDITLEVEYNTQKYAISYSAFRRIFVVVEADEYVLRENP